MPRLIRYVNVKTGKRELAGVVDPHKVQERLQRNCMTSRALSLREPTASISLIPKHLPLTDGRHLLTGFNPGRACRILRLPAPKLTRLRSSSESSRRAATTFIVSARYGVCGSARNGPVVKIYYTILFKTISVYRRNENDHRYRE